MHSLLKISTLVVRGCLCKVQTFSDDINRKNEPVASHANPLGPNVLGSFDDNFF